MLTRQLSRFLSSEVERDDRAKNYHAHLCRLHRRLDRRLRLQGDHTTQVAPPPDAGASHGIDLDGMDRSFKPEYDFFRYANGTWLGRTEIPADRATWGTGAMVGAVRLIRFRGHLLKGNYDVHNDSRDREESRAQSATKGARRSVETRRAERTAGRRRCHHLAFARSRRAGCLPSDQRTNCPRRVHWTKYWLDRVSGSCAARCTWPWSMAKGRSAVSSSESG